MDMWRSANRLRHIESPHAATSLAMSQWHKLGPMDSTAAHALVSARAPSSSHLLVRTNDAGRLISTLSVSEIALMAAEQYDRARSRNLWDRGRVFGLRVGRMQRSVMLASLVCLSPHTNHEVNEKALMYVNT